MQFNLFYILAYMLDRKLVANVHSRTALFIKTLIGYQRWCRTNLVP